MVASHKVCWKLIMSFILDALKKSENERQKHNGPGLFEVKIATRRPGLPTWVIGLSVLLLINLAVILWLMFKPDSGPPEPQAQARAVVSTPEPETLPTEPEPAPVAAVPTQDATASTEPLTANPDDYAPAVPATAATPNTAVLPSYAEMIERTPGSLPDLRLDMHVYADSPPNRFVFINMQKLREGDSLPEGVSVQRITPEGAVLEHAGKNFTIERE
jgi:general secretion pathway protein B